MKIEVTRKYTIDIDFDDLMRVHTSPSDTADHSDEIIARDGISPVEATAIAMTYAYDGGDFTNFIDSTDYSIAVMPG